MPCCIHIDSGLKVIIIALYIYISDGSIFTPSYQVQSPRQKFDKPWPTQKHVFVAVYIINSTKGATLFLPQPPEVFKALIR